MLRNNHEHKLLILMNVIIQNKQHTIYKTISKENKSNYKYKYQIEIWNGKKSCQMLEF